MDTPVKAFISYSHDSSSHEAWVLQLATHLRQHGVDVILDQFDLRLGQDLRFFMEKGLCDSSVVLCICSASYVQKVDTGTGGAGYEGMIISQDLLKNVNTDHIIPIVRNNSMDRKLPKCFGTKYYIDFTDDELYFEKYRGLLYRIYGEDEKSVPPLGNNPFSGDYGQRIAIKSAIDSLKYISPAFEGHVSFRYDNNNHVYTIGSGDYTFKTKWSSCANDAIYAYGIIGIKDGCTTYPKYEDIIDFDFSSTTRTIRKDQVFVIGNDDSHFAAIKLGNVKSSSHGNMHDEMEFDYLIYRDDVMMSGSEK